MVRFSTKLLLASAFSVMILAAAPSAQAGASLTDGKSDIPGGSCICQANDGVDGNGYVAIYSDTLQRRSCEVGTSMANRLSNLTGFVVSSGCIFAANRIVNDTN